MDKIKKEEKDEYKYFKKNKNYYNDISNIKKSFNSYINKSLLKYTENNLNSFILKNDNSKSFSKKLNKYKEFYNFEVDKINIYNYNKFDNITYRTLLVNKFKNNNFI